jgi:hypothetical protein
VFRLTPFAVDAIQAGLAPFQWGALFGNVIFMGYTNGYRVFQRQFSPRVVARAWALRAEPTPARVLFAPFFCMAYFGAVAKRQRIAWGVTIGVVILVLLVRTLAQPWRGIVDAGVVVSLAWAVFAILGFAARAVGGTPPAVSPDLV